jgi:hypothetical protein
MIRRLKELHSMTATTSCSKLYVWYCCQPHGNCYCKSWLTLASICHKIFMEMLFGLRTDQTRHAHVLVHATTLIGLHLLNTLGI